MIDPCVTFEPTIISLRQTEEDYYCAKSYQGFSFYHAKIHTHTYTHTSRLAFQATQGHWNRQGSISYL